MKYLKLYEELSTLTFKEWLNKFDFLHDKTNSIKCVDFKLTDLDGIEKFTDLETLDCSYNNISSLEPIKNLTKLTTIYFHRNSVESLEPLKNLTNLQILAGVQNKINSLKGIENLTQLVALGVRGNNIKTTGELRKLNLISELYTYDNPLEEPIPANIFINLHKFSGSDAFRMVYGNDLKKFRSYEFQKNFLEEHPEKIIDLGPLGLNDRIRVEYKDLLDFFNVKEIRS